MAKNWRVPFGVVEFSFLSNLESKPERTMNRLVPSLKEDGQESIFWLSFCYSLSVKCIDSSLKESSVMRSHIADQTMRMCQRLNDLTPQNGAVVCFGHVMKLCVIFDNNSCSKIQFHKNRNDDKITTICKVTDFQCFAFMFGIYFCFKRFIYPKFVPWFPFNVS